ncbi:sensor histidine kinase [Acidisoma cladoniae]|jgi:signal transduction histidine kinase|uniref:sensor histidine kinase n=1 Tax=Acidisoma cladoniae TaxID=3040935 RepID=UPI00254D2F76|nr:HAMP domain-containing sensor histidine kinase [Acidisoma sp. PAMC 29798]
MSDPSEELVRLRAELDEDRWRLRRLAELGMLQAKINHDLRNMMTSALMIADRLSMSEDAKVSRSGSLLVTLFEQANALVERTVDFTGEKPPNLTPTRFGLAELVAEIAEELCRHHTTFAVENTAPAHVMLEADRVHVGRALGNLLRVSAKAQAKRAVVHVEDHGAMIAIVLTDDGRPFRDVDAAAAFMPFSGTFRYGSTGLGFVVARDLVQAHGGSLSLRDRREDGRTCMVVTLPAFGG